MWRVVAALGVSAALLVVLFRTIDPHTVILALAGAHSLPMLSALAATIAAWVLMAVKWRTLIHRHISFSTALSLTFRSLFYGFVLPGQIAGDVYRSVVFMRRGIAALGMASVVTDRILGLLALVIVGLTGASLSPALRGSSSWGLVMTASASLGALCLLALTLVPKLPAFVTRWNPRPGSIHRHLALRAQSFAVAFASFPTGARVRGFIYSLGFQAMCVLALFFLGNAFDAGVTLADWGWVFALASVVLLVPISIGGIGIREGTLVGALGLIGVSGHSSLPIGVALTLLTAIGALAGAFLELATLLRGRN